VRKSVTIAIIVDVIFQGVLKYSYKEDSRIFFIRIFTQGI